MARSVMERVLLGPDARRIRSMSSDRSRRSNMADSADEDEAMPGADALDTAADLSFEDSAQESDSTPPSGPSGSAPGNTPESHSQRHRRRSSSRGQKERSPYPHEHDAKYRAAALQRHKLQ